MGLKLRIMLVLGATALLAACATTIKTSQPIGGQIQESAFVKEATVDVATGVTVPPDTAKKLEAAVLKAAGEHAGGAKPVKLTVTIMLWSVRDAATRFLVGAGVHS